MKKTIGILAVTVFSVMLFTGCQNINNGVVTDTAEPVPAISDETAANTDDAVITNNPSESSAPDYTLVQTSEIVPTTAEENNPSETVDQIIQTAESLIGIPFAMNGSSPETGFDNPGFIYYVLRENGFINCPRHTAEQASMGTHTDYNGLKKGDLVFFSTDNSGQADFGGIYIGNGQMIYCPYPEQTVQIADISSDYWVNAFFVGVRLS